MQELCLFVRVTFWLGSWSLEPGTLYYFLHDIQALDDEVLENVQVDKLERLVSFIGDASLSNVGGSMDLLDVLDQYCHQLCNDPRDRIFGLLALVKPDQRVAIDYSKSVELIIMEAIVVILQSEVEAFQRLGGILTLASKLDMWWSRLLQTCESVAPNGVGHIMLRTMQSLRWGAIVALTPQILGSNHYLLNRWNKEQNRVIVQKDLACEDLLLSAVNERQRSLAQELEEAFGEDQELNTQLKQLQKCRSKIMEERYRLLDEQGQPLEPVRSVLEDADFMHASERVRTIIDTIAARHGFLWFDGILAHPDDWPSPEEVEAAGEKRTAQRQAKVLAEIERVVDPRNDG